MKSVLSFINRIIFDLSFTWKSIQSIFNLKIQPISLNFKNKKIVAFLFLFLIAICQLKQTDRTMSFQSGSQKSWQQLVQHSTGEEIVQKLKLAS